MGVTTKNSSSQRNKGRASKGTDRSVINGARGAKKQPLTPDPDTVGPAREQAIWQVVASIPKGQVASYGQIAALAGLPGRARFVGRVLSQLPPASRLPWHRVVNAAGRIAERAGAHRQRERLEAEGIALIKGRVGRSQFWVP